MSFVITVVTSRGDVGFTMLCSYQSLMSHVYDFIESTVRW